MYSASSQLLSVLFPEWLGEMRTIEIFFLNEITAQIKGDSYVAGHMVGTKSPTQQDSCKGKTFFPG